MAGKRRRRSGSMFRWYFIQTSVSVLLCLTIASFAVLFFFLAFWKNDKLTALNDDALSVAQSVDLCVNDNEKRVVSKQDLILDVHNVLSAVAKSSSTEIFISDETGKILLCYDSVVQDEADNEFTGLCVLHSYVGMPEEIINGVKASSDNMFSFSGKLSDFSDDSYLVGSTSIKFYDETFYISVLQAESVALVPYTTEFLRMMIFASIIAIIISCILSSMISYRMVRPLKKVTAATKLYSQGDFSVRINTDDVYKELTQLVDSVNKMAANLSVIEESRSSFVANVSHELKTPMTIISGFIDGMLDGTISGEDTRKYLSIVSDEVKRLSRLVVAMLNMSKIEAGKLTLNISSFSASELFIKTLLGFEKYIEDKDIRVEGVQDFEEVIVSADETLINQIVYNLIDNAVKFTPEGGCITLGIREEKKEAVFSVRNTGKGISAEEVGLVFDRFYKVDKSRGLDAKSFGMGLYIVKSIIELHGGTIKVHSEPDEFTEFEVRLPIHGEAKK